MAPITIATRQRAAAPSAPARKKQSKTQSRSVKAAVVAPSKDVKAATRPAMAVKSGAKQVVGTGGAAKSVKGKSTGKAVELKTLGKGGKVVQAKKTGKQAQAMMTSPVRSIAKPYARSPVPQKKTSTRISLRTISSRARPLAPPADDIESMTSEDEADDERTMVDPEQEDVGTAYEEDADDEDEEGEQDSGAELEDMMVLLADTLKKAKLDAVANANADAAERRKVVGTVFMALYKSGQGIEQHLKVLEDATGKTVAEIVASWNKFDEEFTAVKHDLARIERQIDAARTKKREVLRGSRDAVEKLQIKHREQIQALDDEMDQMQAAQIAEFKAAMPGAPRQARREEPPAKRARRS